MNIDIGDEFLREHGLGIIKIVGSDGDDRQALYPDGSRGWVSTDTIQGWVSSGWWTPVTRRMLAGPGEPVCRGCGRLEPYQSGPFTCWSCANGA